MRRHKEIILTIFSFQGAGREFPVCLQFTSGPAQPSVMARIPFPARRLSEAEAGGKGSNVRAGAGRHTAGWQTGAFGKNLRFPRTYPKRLPGIIQYEGAKQNGIFHAGRTISQKNAVINDVAETRIADARPRSFFPGQNSEKGPSLLNSVAT